MYFDRLDKNEIEFGLNMNELNYIYKTPVHAARIYLSRPRRRYITCTVVRVSEIGRTERRHVRKRKKKGGIGGRRKWQDEGRCEYYVVDGRFLEERRWIAFSHRFFRLQAPPNADGRSRKPLQRRDPCFPSRFLPESYQKWRLESRGKAWVSINLEGFWWL